ncbi:2-hydroxyisoflavanone dehydratase [Thalictrum thalictroides]|uniref:2-hydroxyisoflavanone dehydratase n=1 Tax=Thalictrum thalictroides TaxID=46969 RepID=A0A7J6UTB4_THATH|nr:2-hydroxyisoflavanone dehydratase [Thalictrum thalictroides]
MDPVKSNEVAYEMLPVLRVYKDGRVERYQGTEVVPSSLDPHTGVLSKDIMITPQTNVSARIYLPNNQSIQKLPLIIYFHGGRFCIESAFSPTTHHYLNLLVSKSNVIAVSINYRLAPEHPLPTAYDDSWTALQWVATHFKGEGHEVWLKEHVDFGRVFLVGDSAGANIAHNMAMRAGHEGLVDMEIYGVALVHTYFWGEESIGSEALNMEKKANVDSAWPFVCPSSPSNDDPRINPMAVGAPMLSGLGCTSVLVCVAEKDVFRDRGWLYYETLKRSGWKGIVEIVETQGEDHIFHLRNLSSEKGADLTKCLADFFNS